MYPAGSISFWLFLSPSLSWSVQRVPLGGAALVIKREIIQQTAGGAQETIRNVRSLLLARDVCEF